MPDFLEQTALFWPLAVPLATAALCAALWSLPRWQRAANLAGLCLTLIASLALMNAVIADGIQVKQFGGWMPPFGISFVADRYAPGWGW